MAGKSRLGVCGLGLVAGLALTPGVHAQESGEKLEQAKGLFNMGAQLYAAGKYAAAIQNFEAAYKLAPRPALLFSIAQAERRYYFESRQPDYLRKAIAHYKEYLGQVGQGGRRAEAGQALAELELVASKLEPVAPVTSGAPPPPPAPPKPTLSVMATQVKGARISVNGKQTDEGIFSEEVAPGKYSIKVTAEGYFDEEREVVMQNSPLSFDITLKERPAALSFQAPAGAQISVDGRLVGITPLPVPIEVTPGGHVVTVALNGHEAFSTEVDLERGERRSIQANLRRTTQRTVSYGLLGVAGASLIAGGVFSVLALRSQSDAQKVLDAQKERTISRNELDQYNQARDDRDALWRPAAIGSFGAALGLGLVGGLLYAFDQPSTQATGLRERSPKNQPASPSPAAPTMDISAAPGWWGLRASGRF
jgi:hypothetical protein